MHVRVGINKSFILGGSNQEKNLKLHYEIISLIISTSFPNARLDQIILPAIPTHGPEPSLQFQSGLRFLQHLSALGCALISAY